MTLLLCLVGAASAFLLLRGGEQGEGAADPVTAVEGFMAAVYTARDPGRAAELSCAAARDDDKIAGKIREIADRTGAYDAPRFRWSEPRIDEQEADRAVVSTTLTLTTGDERTVDQQLRFVVVEDTGWWVCDVI